MNITNILFSIMKKINSIKIINILNNNKNNIIFIYDFVNKFLDKISKHHIYLISSGIAFNIILYFIPLFLMTIYFVGMIVDIEEFSKSIILIIKDFLPPHESNYLFLSDILKEIDFIFEKKSIAGIVGMSVLLWVSSFFFSSLRSGLNTVFDIPSPRIFIIYRFKDIFLTIILSIFFLIWTFLMPIISIINSFFISFVPEEIRWLFSQFFVTSVSLTSSIILFYFIFSLVPNQKLSRFVRYTSTCLTVILVEISRRLFAYYLVYLASFGKFYGTYAAIVSIAMWIYYFVLIILFSAEISNFIYLQFNIQKIKKK